MFPGYSSMPVSRQPMPRMWLSPSPRTLSQTPCSVSSCFLNGSSGSRMVGRSNSAPSFVGQNALGTTPLGLNRMMRRCLRRAWLAKPRLGRLRMNGRLAAPRPRSRIKVRRVVVVGMAESPVLTVGQAFQPDSSATGRKSQAGKPDLPGRSRFQRGGRQDLHGQFTDVELVVGEGAA